MIKRIRSIAVMAAALAALAFGGSALASASSSSSAGGPEKVSAADPGPAVQQGDQTTPDTTATAKKHVHQTAVDPPGANDTTSPDTGSAVSEHTGETSSENAPSDGPGGFADATQSAGAQQQGEH